MTDVVHGIRRSGNWMASRIDKTSNALDRAFEEGLTGHVVVERAGKRVTLQDGSTAVEFISCSYLGLEQHSALTAAALDALRRFGVHFSIARNRARPDYLGELEGMLSEIYRGNRAVAFGTVSSVHLGVLPLLGIGALPSYPIAPAGPAFLIERTAHSSMQVLRGLMEQLGPVHRFDMTAPESLSGLLVQTRTDRRTPIVLVDGVGSMGGLTDVRGLRGAVAGAGGYLYVDDAHGISVIGRQGAGYAFDVFGDELPDNVVIAGSLSKAFGGIGAFVLFRTEADARMVVKFANPLVFGQSIPIPMLAATAAAATLHLDGTVADLQQSLWRNADEFDRLTGNTLVNAGLRCPIRGVHLETEEKALHLARRLRDAGVLILPAFFPTVARGTGLVRFALSSLHDHDHLRMAAGVLASVEA